MAIDVRITPPNLRELRAQFTELSERAIQGAAATALNRSLRLAKARASDDLAASKGISARKLRNRIRLGRARARQIRSHFTGLVAGFPYDRIGRGRRAAGGHRVGRHRIPRGWFYPGRGVILEREGGARYPTDRATLDLMPEAQPIFARQINEALNKDYPQLTRAESQKRARQVANKRKRRLES